MAPDSAFWFNGATVTVPDAEPFACDTALTVKVVVMLLPLPSDFVGTPLGATYRPLAEINPKAWLPPAMPLTSQVTAELGEPFTDAVNCCVPKLATVAALGDTVTELEAPAALVVTVTAADADFVASACAVAVTVTCGGFGAVAGAVYKPEFVMVPSDAPPATLQVTALFGVPATVAVNCCVFPMATLAVAGTTETETGTATVLSDLAAQPHHRKIERQPKATRTERRMRILTGGGGSLLQKQKSEDGPTDSTTH